MRARKVVLCAGMNEDRMSRRAFLFATWGYRVAKAATAEEALATLKLLGQEPSGAVDLLCIDLPLEGLTPKILAEAKRRRPLLRTLITSNHSAYYDPYGADVLLTKGNDSPAELLERIRIMVVRKRGPQKKPVESETAPRRVEVKHG